MVACCCARSSKTRSLYGAILLFSAYYSSKEQKDDCLKRMIARDSTSYRPPAFDQFACTASQPCLTVQLTLKLFELTTPLSIFKFVLKAATMQSRRNDPMRCMGRPVDRPNTKRLRASACRKTSRPSTRNHTFVQTINALATLFSDFSGSLVSNTKRQWLSRGVNNQH